MGALAGGWSAPSWMTKAMLQRLRVMCDTFWLMSQCVGFSEDLRGVADRPSRRSRLTSLLQVLDQTLTSLASGYFLTIICRVSTAFFLSVQPTSRSPSATPHLPSSRASRKQTRMCFLPRLACPTWLPSCR